MQAVVYSRYGPPEVLHLADIDPPAVGQGDVLIRVHATTVCAGDVRFRKADPFFLRALNGWTAPRKTTVLGMEFAGTVEALGAGVTRFAPGDRVFGTTGLRFGAYADYVCVADGKMVEHMPAAARFEDAAAIPYGAVSALFFLRQARVAAGQEVLVYGASGNVGAFAVQLAKHLGARSPPSAARAMRPSSPRSVRIRSSTTRGRTSRGRAFVTTSFSTRSAKVASGEAFVPCGAAASTRIPPLPWSRPLWDHCGRRSRAGRN
jgi:NADPH:quinone reductase-like Zn-dependent oxidoreductase